MGIKKETPAKRRPRKASQISKAARERGAVLNTARLLELISIHGGSRTAFAELVGVLTSHVSKWLDHGTAPRSRALFRIAERTGASIDWLLGFDVPADREARAVGGDLARQLQSALLRAKPEFASAALVGDPRTADAAPACSQMVVRSVVSSWWEQQRMELSRQHGGALRTLAVRLEEEANLVADPRIATLMRQQAREHSRRGAVLLGNDGTWRDLFELQPGQLCSDIPGVTRVALRNRDETAIAYLQAPFAALGGQRGIGVAWRTDASDSEGAATDHAVFIDAGSMEVRHVAGAGFLQGLTIANRFGTFHDRT